MDGQLAEPAAEIHQIVGRDLLIAENDQLVLDQGVPDHPEHLVRQWRTKVDAADLGAQIGADPGHGDAGAFNGEGPGLPGGDGLVHLMVLPVAVVIGRSKLSDFVAGGAMLGTFLDEVSTICRSWWRSSCCSPC